ncbi:DUF6701 domain-containing protein [Shewanella maritima]|uniref:DUF6701 domain-containing protein n=1 Tax=Shewanella maritima TaxID=2520507 RepID=UPI001F5E713B|nr:DUF6701 domain-containing protein [Shewanella maritima]
MAIKRIIQTTAALVAGLSLYSSAVSAFDPIDENAIWPAVAQGHHSNNNSGCNQISNPQLTIFNSSSINGTQGNDLAFCSINTSNGLPNDSCDDGAGGTRACTVTGSSIRGLQMNGNQGFRSSSGADGGIGFCRTGEVYNLGDSGDTQFSSLSLYADCEVNFSNSNSEYRFNSIAMGSGAKLVFPTGDYWIGSLQINATSEIEAGENTRIFISQLAGALNGGVINSLESAGVQVITYGGFSMNSQSIVNADMYVEEGLTLNSSTVNGRVTAKSITMTGTSEINRPAEPVVPFHIQYGKATSTVVSFDNAFPTGVTPLVFLMPTVADTSSNGDGPASVRLVGTPSTTGFVWEQAEPPSPGNRYTQSVPMPEVHWIAVTPGTHDLANGQQLHAGTVDIDTVMFGGNSPYTDVPLPAGHDVFLSQRQTYANDCWFTTTSQFTNTGAELALDTSEVRSNAARCQPANRNNNQIVAETVAFMSVQSGTGVLALNSENVNYHFGAGAQTFTAGSIRDLNYQCAFTTPLTGFTDVPIFVAGKNSRRGGDGGWLRRCQLTEALVSMVIDEDTYRDSDRRHVWENYSFIALQKEEVVEQCFTDDFNRNDLGTDWVTSSSRGNFTPSIVGSRLRVTEAAGNQATSSTYQRLFSGSDNKVVIEFDHYAYDGSGADGIAFVLSDASITPQPGSYGGPLGYGARSNVDGFAGGWLGFGIDEYGNFSTEGGPDGPGRRRQSVAIRGSGSGTSGYKYLRGTCDNGQTNPGGNCLTPTVDNNNVNPAHRYRITVDSEVAGQSIVSVERDTGNGFTMLIPPFDAAADSDQAAIPTDFLLSLTGSTGGATNIHEIDNVEICALESRPIGVVIDHFEFDHTGSGLTCAPETLTLKACANPDCSQLVPDQVTATLSPASIPTGGGWVGGNVVTFSGGQTTLQLRNNTPGAVTLDVIGSTPGAKPFSQTLCSIAGGTATAANCSLTFADTGFIFDTDAANKDTATQFAKLANKPLSMTIAAVKKDDATEQCVPTFANQAKSISLWSSYVDPSAGGLVATSSVTVDNTNIGKSATSATQLALNFDAQGEASFTLNYPDAGKIQLDASYSGTGEEAGLVMTGNVEVVNFPVGLCISQIENQATCPSGDASCSVFKRAGESFMFEVRGKAWQADGDADYCDNLNTPNYAHGNMQLSHSLVAPSPGQLGSISNASYNHVAAVNNANNVTQTVSEVGVFDFSVKPQSSYLGSSFYDIPQASTGNTGRFVPASFAISGASVLPACGGFSYMEQPFPVAFNISAQNLNSVTTQNYQGAFAKGTASLAGENANDGVDLSARLSSLPVGSGSWSAGVATVDSSYRATFARTTAPNVDGPYSQLDVGVQVYDNDGDFAFVASPDMRPDTSGDCQTPSNTCTAKRLGTKDMRHGRVLMDNTYGPESEVLMMPVYAQFWNGTNWQLNTDDSCSIISGALSPLATYNPALSTGETVQRSGQFGQIINGQQTLLWQNVGTNNYRGQVLSPLDVDSWLEWYWNYDSLSPNTLSDPQSSAFFGRYRGHDRVIYWREVRQ